MKIFEIIHPEFMSHMSEWTKWRLTYQSGSEFIDNYLKKWSARESDSEFTSRKAITYCPSFAKTGINEIRDSIYERMVDITRSGGTKSYREAIYGLKGGVDLTSSSMSYFMGCKILPELLTMGKVGIYVDMPPRNGESIADNRDNRPYIYMYPCESIRCWLDDGPTSNEFSAILLEDRYIDYDPETGFPRDLIKKYRRVWKDQDGLIRAVFYNDDSDQMLNQYGEPITEPLILGIDKVPFVVLELSESLLTDVADYQIALLNLASTDMSYHISANFPIYTEQYNPRYDAPHLRPAGKDEPGTAVDGATGKAQEIRVGYTKGRRYPTGSERPSYIHPSSEPVMASMAKQEQLKNEIRQLLKLSVSNLRGPKMASAESKKEDSRSLETGLSYIGLTLEAAERKISELWSAYEGSSDIATINYPETYSLRSEEDRLKEANELNDLMVRVPSITYQKAIAKRIARIMLGPKVSRETFLTIEKEIDSAIVLDNNPKNIQIDIETGLVSAELASKIRGYPPGEAEKASQDHANRLARISAAQTTGVSGVPDTQDRPKTNASNEKKSSRETTQDDVVADKTRGEGSNPE